MQAEQIVQSILTASPQVQALVPAQRIRTSGENINVSAPYIVHGCARENVQMTHDGPSKLRTAEYSVSVFAAEIDDAYAISEAVIAALSGSHSLGAVFVATGRRRSYDFDARLWEVENLFTAGFSPA